MVLSDEESRELEFLAWIVVADLPMSQEQYDRYNELKDKRDRWVAPKARPGELYSQYLERVVVSLEEWVNR